MPTFLGGTNEMEFPGEQGPWLDYDLINPQEPGSIVGVRRKDDPEGEIFTP